MISWFRNLITGAASTRDRLSREKRACEVEASFYDAAQNSVDMDRLFLEAKDGSADFHADRLARKQIRNRARYEVANNPVLRGMVKTWRHDVIGNGPRLQLTPGQSGEPGRPRSDARQRDMAARLEQLFTQWARDIRLGEKLRTAHTCRLQDGEVFMVFETNMRLKNDVKLDIGLIEAEQVTGDALGAMTRQTNAYHTDGIELDALGNPVRYWMYRSHPYESGSPLGSVQSDSPEPVPADMVIHWYTRERASQHRGVSELAPALPFAAILRAYTMNVLKSSASAAGVSYVVHTNNVANIDFQPCDPMDTWETQTNMALTMPAGYQITQLRAEQPTGTFDEFSRNIIIQMGRAINMPSNKALGDSSDHNYASGRLDHQDYFRACSVERFEIGLMMTQVYTEWLKEARFTGILDESEVRFAELARVEWFFDAFEHVDPEKIANGNDMAIRNGTLSLKRYYASMGLDWEEEITQIEEERARIGLLLRPELEVQREQVAVSRSQQRSNQDQEAMSNA